MADFAVCLVEDFWIHTYLLNKFQLIVNLTYFKAHNQIFLSEPVKTYEYEWQYQQYIQVKQV